MPLKDQFLALAVVLAWALNVIIVKLGIAEIPPIFLSALRFALVALLIIPFTKITRQQLPWVVLVSVTFGCMHFGLMFLGLSMAEAGTAAILVQLGAPIATILAAFILKERFGTMRIIGILLAVAGIGVLAAGPTLPGPVPFVLLMLSATGWAVTNIVIKSAPAISPLTLTGWSALATVPQLLLASEIFETGQLDALSTAGWHGWLSVVYSAVVSSIAAYGIWYWLLQRHPINSVVPYSMLSPLFAVIFGIVLLGDTPAPVKLAGGMIMLVGVALVLRQPAAKTAEDTQKAA